MTHKIAQIVDSSGGIPREILRKYNIREVAFHINFGGDQDFQEHINISSEEFYERMKDDPTQIPKTSIPSVIDWTQAFAEKYTEGYRELLVTTIAQQLSSSFQSATMAAEAFTKNHPDVRIEVIESNTCACGQAALEIKIAQIIEQGQMLTEELVKRIKDIIPGVVTLFSVNELTYMRAGGRIGGAAAWLGKLINIKPVCEFIGGVVHPIKPARCRKKALQHMVDEAVKRIKYAEDTIICVQHALCEEDADFLIAQLREKLNFHGTIYKSMVGAVVGAHSGPGAIGIGIA